MLEQLKNELEKIIQYIKNSDKRIELLNEIIKKLYNTIGFSHPVGCVQWIKIDKIFPNEYNPNSVPSKELELLYKSIKNDGYTQPSVVYYDRKKDKYIIVDGFHRYFIMKTNKEIYNTTGGYLPCVVLEKDINDRIASTIRHNRARGKHAIKGMINIVYELLNNGWSDDKIMEELGMEREELTRLKYISGFAKLFDGIDYSKAWETEKQIYYKQNYDKNKKSKTK